MAVGHELAGGHNYASYVKNAPIINYFAKKWAYGMYGMPLPSFRIRRVCTIPVRLEFT